MVDAHDSKSCLARGGGSSPLSGTRVATVKDTNITNFIASILPTIQSLGVFGYWIVLIFALLESLAFVGITVPGATIVVFAGILSAQGYLDLGDLILFATIGAILGDTISYYLGSRGKYLFRPESRFLSRLIDWNKSCLNYLL